jgi:hypothetical protein
MAKLGVQLQQSSVENIPTRSDRVLQKQYMQRFAQSNSKKPTVEIIKEKLQQANIELQETENKYDKKEQKKRDWWSSKSSEYRHKDNNSERYHDWLDKNDDRKDVALAEIRGYKEGLNKASNQLDPTLFYDINSIENYANKVGKYEKLDQKAKNENRNDFYDKAEAGDLDDQFEKLGLDKNKPSYYGYNKKVDTYNKDVDLANKIGFDKISTEAQKRLNPDLVAWQKSNPNEKLQFDGMNISGVESDSYKQSMSFDNYQKVIDPDYQWNEIQKANPTKYSTPTRDLTFNEVAKQQSIAQPNIYDNFKKASSGNIKTTYKTITAGNDLPSGYGSQQTAQFDMSGNVIPASRVISFDEYTKVKEMSVETGSLGLPYLKNIPTALPKEILKLTGAGLSTIEKNIHFTGDMGRPIVFGEIKKVDAPKILTSKDLPIGYGSEGTLQFDAMGKVKGTTIINPVDKRTFEERYGLTMPEATVDLALINRGIRQNEIIRETIGGDKVDKFDTAIQDKFEKEYQYKFDQKYMKALIYGEIDYETASKEFKDSASAKKIQSDFEKEYGEGFMDLRKEATHWKGWNTGFGSGIKGGLKYLGVSAEKLGLKVIRSPTRVAGTTAGVVTGIKLLGAIPKPVNLALSGGFGVHGTYKFLSPQSDFVEKAGGLIEMGLAFGSLGKSGYNYIKQAQKVKTVSVKPDMASLKSVGSDATEISYVKDGETMSKIYGRTGKISQTVTEGSRTIWTSKGRDILNKFNSKFNYRVKIGKIGGTGLNTRIKLEVLKPSTTPVLKDLYQGIPTAQLGSTTYKGLVVIKKQSAYQKMLNRIIKYNRYSTPQAKYNKYSTSQAKSLLKYNPATVKVQTLTNSEIIVTGDTAIARAEYMQTQPIITINKELGIKTRGAKPIKTIIDQPRILMKTDIGKAYSQYYDTSYTGHVNKLNDFTDLKVLQKKIGVTLSGASKTKVGDKWITEEIYQSNQPYKDILSKSFDKQLLKVEQTSQGSGIYEFGVSNTNINKASWQRLYKKIVDLNPSATNWVSPANIKKTPLSKTFGITTKNVKSDTVKKIIDKIDDFDYISNKITLKNIEKESLFYGKGVYEQSIGGGSLTIHEKSLLASPIKAPQMKVTQLKELLLEKQLPPLTAVKTKSLFALAGIKTIGLREKLLLSQNKLLTQNYELDTLLKTDTKVKTALKTKTALKSQLKTKTALKSQLKSILNMDILAPITSSPLRSPIKTPSFSNPVIPFSLWLDRSEQKKKGKKKTQKITLEKAYLPDFTSRAIGLKGEDVNIEQLMKKINKVQTGLEIRRGVKVKW